jgi:glutamine amidotransferase
MTVLVVDYGMGNLGSVRRALEECGADVLISDNPHDLKLASRILLPGVGAFCDGMNHLSKGGWIEALQQTVLEDKIPVLGICLGMQLMMSQGDEGGGAPGLGFFEGQVRRMVPQHSERIPHVGWNELHVIHENPLLHGIPNGTDFYFVHSYFVDPVDGQQVIANVPYAGGVPAVIGRDNIWGAQFHPEKSAKAGFQLIKNFLEATLC